MKPVKPSSKAAATPKPRVASGASKKKAAKVLKEIDENGTDDVMDVDQDKVSDDDFDAPTKKIPLQAKGKDKTATEMYQKVF